MVQRRGLQRSKREQERCINTRARVCSSIALLKRSGESRIEQTLTLQELHHPAMLAATPSGLPLGGSHNLALEILQGKDEGLDEADFMSGGADMREILDVSAVMERSRGL